MGYSEKEVKKIFSDRLKSLLKAKQILDTQLADELRRTPGQVGHWKAGRYLPGLGDLMAIAKFMGTSVDYLLGVENPHPPQILENQEAANQRFETFLAVMRPRNVFLIQYSAANVEKVINKAIENECYVFLLVKNPSYLPSANEVSVDRITMFQQNKIITNLQRLLYSDESRHLSQNRHFSARCYRFPGALRGIYAGTPRNEKLQEIVRQSQGKVGEDTSGLLSLSTYRYTRSFEGILGGSNPLVHLDTLTDEGQLMTRFFEEAFVELWENGISVTDVIPPPPM